MSVWVSWIQVDNIQAPEKGKISHSSVKIKYFLLLNKVDIVRMHGNSDLENREWCLKIMNVEPDTRGMQWLSFAILSFQTSVLICWHGNESQHINQWFKNKTESDNKLDLLQFPTSLLHDSVHPGHMREEMKILIGESVDSPYPNMLYHIIHYYYHVNQ